MTTTTLLVGLIVLIALPLVIVWNVTESKKTKINRARRNGLTWAAIANRYGVSPSTARRWARQ